MNRDPDEQTQRIVQFLKERRPEYVHQIEWRSNTFVRCVDFLLAGAIGRLFLERGQRASGWRANELLSKAIATTSSRKVMAKALFYRGNYLFEGAADADRSIADYGLAIWCDPTDCWARKDQATIYEIYHASYGKQDKTFSLPMTHKGAGADVEAAIQFFRSLAESHPSSKGQGRATRMIEQCEEVLRKLRAHDS